jgi:hypothetical protein
MSRNACFKLASRLVLPTNHKEQDQIPVHDEFLSGLLDLGLSHFDGCVASDYGGWLTRHLIFRNNATSKSRRTENGRLWNSSQAGSVSSVAKGIRSVFHHGLVTRLAIVVGQTRYSSEGKRIGHCQVLIIERSDDSYQIRIKDCLPMAESTILSNSVALAVELNVRTIKLYPELPTETSPACLLEAYRFVGTI